MYSGLLKLERGMILGLIAAIGAGLAVRHVMGNNEPEKVIALAQAGESARAGESVQARESGQAGGEYSNQPPGVAKPEPPNGANPGAPGHAPAQAPVPSPAMESTRIAAAPAASPGVGAAPPFPAPEAPPSETPASKVQAAGNSAGEAASLLGPVDLNTATLGDLQRVPGIGPKKAVDILSDRAANGPYARLEDLDRVKGFGMESIERLRPFLGVKNSSGAADGRSERVGVSGLGEPGGRSGLGGLGGQAPSASSAASSLTMVSAAAASSAPRASTRKAFAPPAADGRPIININTASVSELEKLPGVGPGLAARIVAYRLEHGPFKSVEDLRRVKGIGPKIFSRLRDCAAIQ